MTQKLTSEMVLIPFDQILVPDGNYRSDLPKIKEIAESLKERGQLTPIIVTNGGDGEKPYTLVGGWRRMEAWKLNGWTKQPIMAVVREYKKGDALGRILDNWTSNEESESTSPFDQAELVHSLASGTYAVLKGEKAEPVEKDEIVRLLNVSKSHFHRLLKIFHCIDPDVARKARKEGAPLRLLFTLSQIEGKGKDKDAQNENRAELQDAMLQAYCDHQKSLEEAGRKRAPRKAKGAGAAAGDEGGEGGGERAPAVKPTKKLDEKGRTASDFLKVMLLKLADASKDEGLRLQGQIDATRFFTGEIKRMPGIVASDFKLIAEVEEEEETEEEAVEE